MHIFSAIVSGKYGAIKYYGICTDSHRPWGPSISLINRAMQWWLPFAKHCVHIHLPFVIYNNSGRRAGKSSNPYFINEDPDPREVNDLSKDNSHLRLLPILSL